MTEKIIICDDDKDRAQDWRADIEAVPGVADLFEVEALEPERFAAVYAALKDRKGRVAKTADVSVTGGDAAILDDAALLIVDYDLTPDDRSLEEASDPDLLEREFAGESGDKFVYLARCYSRVGFTVVVNEWARRSTFDLTMTMFTESIADLNVSATDLDRHGLWSGASSPDTFRPWHWPALAAAPARLAAFAAAVDLDAAVLETIGFTADDLVALSAEQTDSLAVTQTTDDDVELSLEALTFRDVATRTRLGLVGRQDKQHDPQILRLVAASAVLRWLERVVMPGQNVLIDAPHMIERHPALLGDRVGDVSAWQATAPLHPTEASVGLFPDLESSLAPVNQWVSRPVWRVQAVAAHARGLPTMPGGLPDVVFCEDDGAFHPLAEAREFTSGVGGPYRQRFVRRLDDPTIDYRPRNRLLT